MNLLEITDAKEDSFYDNNLLSSPEMKKVIATKKLPERLILLVFSFRNQKRIEVAVVFSKSSDQGLIRSLSVLDRKQQDRKFCKTDFLARFYVSHIHCLANANPANPFRTRSLII